MTKIILKKTTSAIFLAIVLIVGTFAAISPSFMIGAHAQQYEMNQKYNSYEQNYGMDSYDKKLYGKDSNSYDKSKDSSSNVIVKKNKCNNIIVNLNGFNGALPTGLSGLATDEAQASADEGEVGANSVGSDGGRQSGSDSDSRFVCINNNEFNVNEGNGDETDECDIKLKACFEQFLGVGFDQFEEGLANGIDIIINGEEVAFNSFEGMCLALKGVPSGQLEVALQDIITDATGGFPPITIEFLTCVAEAVGLPLPPWEGRTTYPFSLFFINFQFEILNSQIIAINY